MSLEQWLLCGLLVAVIFLILFVLYTHHKRNQREEELMEELQKFQNQLELQVDRKLHNIQSQLITEMDGLDDKNQKRHNYLKKSFNDINDRIDVVEDTNKRVADLYFQLERYNIQLGELSTRFPLSTATASSATTPNSTEMNTNIGTEGFAPLSGTENKPEHDREVQEVLALYHQGFSPEEIAQRLGRAVPEVTFILKIFVEDFIV